MHAPPPSKHRASLRPRAPPLLQRLLVATVVALCVGSLVCMRQISTRWAATTSPESASARLRAGALAWHRIVSGQKGSTLRNFFKQRTSVLSLDQDQVVRMTRHAWRGYRDFGNWSDHLNVVNRTGDTMYEHDMAFTLVDSLDTLFIMGMHEEFDEASQWVRLNLHERMFAVGHVNFFETTIRSLGSLLSAYYLSGQQHFLDLATALGDALEQNFVCGQFIPCQYIDLKTMSRHGSPPLAEATSFQLEFIYLAVTTRKFSHLDHVSSVNKMMEDMARDFYPNGLIPEYVDWDVLRGFPANFTVGARGDSYYEYLLKQWLLTGKHDDVLRARYVQAVEGIKAKLVGRSTPTSMTFVGILTTEGKLIPEMDHLACFLPGLLALGVYHGLPSDHLELAKELMETCVQMYLQSFSHLAPETTYFRVLNISQSAPVVPSDAPEMWTLRGDDCNLLRPETVESLMMLYRVTKDEKYRAYGREIMHAFEKHSKVEGGGYRSTRNVVAGPIETHGSVMESFFISETLKYLFLLFSGDDILPLEAVVFNTEAHPFPIQQ